MEQAKRKKPLTRLPVLPLRGTMVFPHMVLHFDVGRAKSVSALEKAMLEDQRIFLVAQRDADADSPVLSDLYTVGTIAKVKQVLNLPGDSLRVLVAGEKRAKLKNLIQDEPFLLGEITVVSKRKPKTPTKCKRWFAPRIQFLKNTVRRVCVYRRKHCKT